MANDSRLSLFSADADRSLLLSAIFRSQSNKIQCTNSWCRPLSASAFDGQQDAVLEPCGLPEMAGVRLAG